MPTSFHLRLHTSLSKVSCQSTEKISSLILRGFLSLFFPPFFNIFLFVFVYEMKEDELDDVLIFHGNEVFKIR